MPPKTKAQIAREHVPSVYFPEFWKLYPRKVNRLEASIAYARLAPDAQLALKILIAVNVQKTHGCLRAKPNGDVQYIPHASTWLNQRRWEDEVESPSAPTDHRTDYAIDTVLDILDPAEDTRVNGTGDHQRNGTVAPRDDDGRGA